MEFIKFKCRGNMKKKNIILLFVIILCNVFIIGKVQIKNRKSSSYDYIENTSSNIYVFLEDLLYDANENYYYVSEVLDSINGKINSIEEISEIMYKIEDEKGKILLQGNIEGSKEFTINNIGLALGINKISIEVRYSNNKVESKEIIFLNLTEKNHHNLEIDLNDSDNDEILNYYEEFFGTNKDNRDSDGDGLRDYEEIYITITDPTKIDSNENGISDLEEDFDNDGLNNIYEIELGGNPLVYDKELAENSEEEKNEVKTKMQLSKRNIDEEFFKDNLAVPSLYYEGTDEINNELYLLDIKSNINNNSVIGKIVTLENNTDNEVELAFDMSKAIEKGQTINNLVICKCENNTFNIQETFVNETSISTSVKDDGQYFVLDVKGFIEELSKKLEENEVILKNFNKVKLSNKLNKNNNNNNTDNDGVSDYTELSESIEINLEKYVKILVDRENRSMNSYTGITKIKVYDNISDPTKINSDNDGFDDKVDPNPLMAKEFRSYSDYVHNRYKDKYVLTVFSRQPIFNSRAVINLNKLDSGHSEISIDKGKSNVGIYGFYPYERYSIYDVLYFNSCRGKLRLKDSYYITDTKENILIYEEPIIDVYKGEWNVAKTFIISKDIIDKINSFSKNYNFSYNMVTKNCATYVVEALKYLDMDLKVEKKPWSYLGETINYHTTRFKGYTPADLGQDIIENYDTYITNEEIPLSNGKRVKAVIVN